MGAQVKTLGELVAVFLNYVAKEIGELRNKQATLEYYELQLRHFTAAVPTKTPLKKLIAFDLIQFATSRASVQAPKRLFAWAAKVGLFRPNPFADVELPEAGERERKLKRWEITRWLRACNRALRLLLLAQFECVCRPQEVRDVTWDQYHPEIPAFVLTEFKAKRRRKKKNKVKVRLLPVMPWLERMLARMDKRPHGPKDRVFLRKDGKPWNNNAVRIAVRRAVTRAGLDDDSKERIVAYTLRHTAATEDTLDGVAQSTLAKVMGHADIATTARYQHEEARDLVDALKAARDRNRAKRRAKNAVKPKGKTKEPPAAPLFDGLTILGFSPPQAAGL
jgi:integrase